MILERVALLVGALRGVRDGVTKPASAPPEPHDEIDPSDRRLPHDRRAELLVALLLIGSGAAGLAFTVFLVLDSDTQVLGLTLGAALALLAAALIVAGKRVVVQEVVVDERHPMSDEAASHETVAIMHAGVEGISRRRLLTGAAGVAGTGLAAAMVVPAASLGPGAHGRLGESPWRRGTRLVHDDGSPVHADELELGSFLTAYPEGADRRELGSPVVVVRVAPNTIDLPAGREAWAPDGLLAFSKICTHAGCAVSLFRYPLDEDTSKPPALVCPCHYSTFDVRHAARPIFGPAVRALPQLPLRIDSDRTLRADGGFSGSVGPSWWKVDRT